MRAFLILIQEHRLCSQLWWHYLSLISTNNFLLSKSFYHSSTPEAAVPHLDYFFVGLDFKRNILRMVTFNPS